MIKDKKRVMLCLCFLAASLVIGWHPFWETITLARQNDSYTHILLILPLSLFMILGETQLLRTASMWSVYRGGVLVLIAVAIGCSAWIWSGSLTADMLLSVRMFALVLSWIGFFLFCFGSQPSRKLIFPLLFLFGLVPLPHFALDALVALLQVGSAWSAHAFFAAVRVPVFQEGVLLTIPGLTIQVAKECSSIRSSSMLIVTSLVVAEVLLRSFWRKAIVVCVALPLSILKNGLRIFVIAMLGTRVDRSYLTGQLHHQGGIVFFAVALGCVLILLWLLRRREHLAGSSIPKPLNALTTGD